MLGLGNKLRKTGCLCMNKAVMHIVLQLDLHRILHLKCSYIILLGQIVRCFPYGFIKSSKSKS